MRNTKVGSQKLVFVDLDGTMLKGDSFRSMLKDVYWPSKRLPVLIGAGFLRKLRIISLKRFKEFCLIPFKGWTMESINSWGVKFYERSLKSRILSESIITIREHKDKGHILVLATGSPEIYLGCLVSDLGFDHLICTRLEYQAGIFTGRISGADCLGVSKYHQAVRLATEIGADLRAAYFYTDHASDKSLLETVGNPRIINPKQSFKQEAHDRGWPVTAW
jgi:putative phosphoserine phosphatase/1-acylglycerol-3-phosphate O-acyltransferase